MSEVPEPAGGSCGLLLIILALGAGLCVMTYLLLMANGYILPTG